MKFINACYRNKRVIHFFNLNWSMNFENYLRNKDDNVGKKIVLKKLKHK